MGKGPELGGIMALARTLKTSVSGMHGGAGVGGKTVGNKAEEDGWGQVSCLAISQQTPPRGFVPSLSLGKLRTLYFACVSLALPQSAEATGFQFLLLVCHLLAGRGLWGIFFFTSLSFSFLSCRMGVITIAPYCKK